MQRFCGTNDYCWIHHGRTLSLSLEPGAEPAKEVNKMCKNHGKKHAHTDKVFKRGGWEMSCCSCLITHTVTDHKKVLFQLECSGSVYSNTAGHRVALKQHSA